MDFPGSLGEAPPQPAPSSTAPAACEAWEKATKAAGYAHDRTNVSKSGKKAHEVLPAVSRVASQLKRWLGGTLQGAVTPEHLQAYCHEFEFRFNRRRSRHRGQLFYRLLSQAAHTPPTGADSPAAHQFSHARTARRGEAVESACGQLGHGGGAGCVERPFCERGIAEGLPELLRVGLVLCQSGLVPLSRSYESVQFHTLAVLRY